MPLRLPVPPNQPLRQLSQRCNRLSRLYQPCAPVRKPPQHTHRNVFRSDHTLHRQTPPPHLRVRSPPPPISRRTHQPGGATATETAPPVRRRALMWDQGIREKFMELHSHHLLPSIFGSPRCF